MPAKQSAAPCRATWELLAQSTPSVFVSFLHNRSARRYCSAVATKGNQRLAADHVARAWQCPTSTKAVDVAALRNRGVSLMSRFLYQCTPDGMQRTGLSIFQEIARRRCCIHNLPSYLCGQGEDIIFDIQTRRFATALSKCVGSVEGPCLTTAHASCKSIV